MLVERKNGFTLVELATIALIIGIIVAIAAPSWLMLLTRQRLYTARANALSKVRQAQSEAIRTARPWETCFRDVKGYIEVSVQPSGLTYNCTNHKSWEPLLESDITTIALSPLTSTSLGDMMKGYSFRFNLHGDRIGFDGGRKDSEENDESEEDTDKPGEHLVFLPRNQTSPLYCIVSRTIIGAIEEGKFDTTNEVCK